MRLLMLTLALGVAACAETPKETAARLQAEDKTRAGLDRELAGLTPGPPQGCIQTFEQRDLKAYGDTLVYRTGSVRYVTQTTGCRGIGDDNILVTRSHGTQLCRGDIATTVNRTAQFETGSCSFGDFTPYRKP